MLNISVGQTIQALGVIKPSQFVKLANLVGFDHLEFDPTVFDDIEGVKKNLGRQTVTIHAPYFMDWGYELSSIVQAERVNQFLTNLAQYGDILGASSVVVHPNSDPAGNEEFLLRSLEKIHQLVLLENLPGQSFDQFRQWYLGVKQQSSARIGICFDVPHSILTHSIDKIFDIPSDLLPDLHYIHVSDLNGQEDCHWPFCTEGGMFPFARFREFLNKIQFKGIINMEMLPTDLTGVENLMQSFLMLEKCGSALKYYRKKIQISFIKPMLLRKLQGVSFQKARESHV